MTNLENLKTAVKAWITANRQSKTCEYSLAISFEEETFYIATIIDRQDETLRLGTETPDACVKIDGEWKYLFVDAEAEDGRYYQTLDGIVQEIRERVEEIEDDRRNENPVDFDEFEVADATLTWIEDYCEEAWGKEALEEQLRADLLGFCKGLVESVVDADSDLQAKERLEYLEEAIEGADEDDEERQKLEEEEEQTLEELKKELKVLKLRSFGSGPSDCRCIYDADAREFSSVPAVNLEYYHNYVDLGSDDGDWSLYDGDKRPAEFTETDINDMAEMIFGWFWSDLPESVFNHYYYGIGLNADEDEE